MNDKLIGKYTAEFDKYYVSEKQELFLQFIDVKDEHGNLVKEALNIPVNSSSSPVKNLIGNIILGGKVFFTARMVVDSSCSNGCNLLNISEIKQLNENTGGDDE